MPRPSFCERMVTGVDLTRGTNSAHLKGVSDMGFAASPGRDVNPGHTLNGCLETMKLERRCVQWLAVTVSAESQRGDQGVAGLLPASWDGAADSTPPAV